MPVRRRSLARVRRPLTFAQKLDLVIGCSRTAAFDSEAERREAWRIHRDELLQFGNRRAGHRPAGWWLYESPEPLGRPWWGVQLIDRDDPTELESEQLIRMGVLDAEEREEVEAEWERADILAHREAADAYQWGRAVWSPHSTAFQWESLAQALRAARYGEVPLSHPMREATL